MLRLERDALLHSPIVSGGRNACIEIDDFKLSFMPEMPSSSSVKVEEQPQGVKVEQQQMFERAVKREEQPQFDQVIKLEEQTSIHQDVKLEDQTSFHQDVKLEEQTSFDHTESPSQTLMAGTSDSNNNCYTHHNMSHSHNGDTNPNLQSVSFHESIDDNIMMSDIISDYEDNDIELMQEALSLLVDDKRDESHFNRCDLRHRETEMNNHFSKECSGFSHFPAHSFQLKSQVCSEGSRRMTADQENSINSKVECEISNDLHPLLVPQVTFDEEEDFDRKTFFDQEKPFYRHSENQSDIPMVSPPRSYNQPSDWLLQQIPSPFQQTLSDVPMCSTPKPRTKVDVRASLETKHKHWSKEEDEMLKLATETEMTGPIDWIQIAQNYFNNSRSATQCKNRWKNYLKPGVVRGNWQKHEDEFIVSMVSRGFKWVDIAKGLPGRTGEHVRERFVNVLDGKLKKTSWTKEEDRILFEQQRLLGNKWSEIRKLLPGRSDNSIKNRYHNRRNAYLRRLKREALQKNGTPPLAK